MRGKVLQIRRQSGEKTLNVTRSLVSIITLNLDTGSYHYGEDIFLFFYVRSQIVFSLKSVFQGCYEPRSDVVEEEGCWEVKAEETIYSQQVGAKNPFEFWDLPDISKIGKSNNIGRVVGGFR